MVDIAAASNASSQIQIDAGRSGSQENAAAFSWLPLRPASICICDEALLAAAISTIINPYFLNSP